MIKTVMMIPAVISGLWLVDAKPSGAVRASVNVSSPVAVNEAPAPAQSSEASEQLQATMAVRRLRSERILKRLESVAEVSMQMSQENSARLEPVLVDLAEQTMDLTSDESLKNEATDRELTHLEGVVDRLVSTVSNVVEPEISL